MYTFYNEKNVKVILDSSFLRHFEGGLCRQLDVQVVDPTVGDRHHVLLLGREDRGPQALHQETLPDFGISHSPLRNPPRRGSSDFSPGSEFFDQDRPELPTDAVYWIDRSVKILQTSRKHNAYVVYFVYVIN